jgi:dTDP-glucose 4,6-dehydratase
LFTGKKIPVYGEGKNVREWIHVEDHCVGIQKVIQSGVKGEIYNIGSEESFTNLELIHLIAKNLDINNFEIEFVKDSKGHDFRYSLDSRKIQTNLNFKPTKRIETSINEFAHLYSISGPTP